MSYSNPKLERVKGTAQDCLIKPVLKNKTGEKKEKQAGQKPNMNSIVSKMVKGGVVGRKV